MSSGQSLPMSKADRARVVMATTVSALAIAGLADLALVEHWASGGARPALEEIPGLVLTLLLGPRPAEEG